ncbi:MAG: hypothetical protein ACREYC_24900 [Gammaproteobacteria bacterium]
MTLKERHTKALRKKADRGFAGYPVATVAYYGPNDQVATKVAVGIIAGEDQEPIAMERWFSEGADLRADHEVNERILLFIRSHGAKSVVIADRIIGCPHEEGIDYPEGEKCPKCPSWAYRDRWTGETEH